MHTAFRDRVVTIVLISLSVLLLAASAIGSSVTDPWTNAQLLSPESLNKRLAETKGAKPLII